MESLTTTTANKLSQCSTIKLKTISAPQNASYKAEAEGEEEEELISTKLPTSLNPVPPKASSIPAYRRKMAEYSRFGRFHYVLFEPQISDFRNAIADTEFLVENELDIIEYSARLNFTRYLFQTLVDSGDRLKRYGRSNIPGHDLVRDMIDLNVRVMYLYDSHGEIDYSIKNFSEKVDNFYHMFNLLGVRFKRLRNVPLGMRLVFENHSSQVNRTLEYFDEQIRED
ncbi:hypothetical protein JCM33374_g2916 [Metschnikowia sp. JCM 33374]|nr:hypothetical protein JCM33374_g2916 [Metschnikowia sp. JCM 33374]